MKNSSKLFIVSVIIFACSLGFFLGAFSFGCKEVKGNDTATIVAESAPKAAEQKNPHKDRFNFQKMSAFLDSALQITSEQSEALERQRVFMDSSYKKLFEQKRIAEKSLHEALSANDSANIATARDNILKVQEALLDLRIEGVRNWNKVLTREQIEKFKQIQEEHKKNFKKHHWGKKHKPSHKPADSASTPSAE